MSAKNLSEENKMLAQNNAGIMRELDKVTGQLHEAQDSLTELNEKLAERKHSEQLAGWAIDRALETAKLNSAKEGFSPKSEDVISDAAKFCDWIVSSSIQPKKQIHKTEGNA